MKRAKPVEGPEAARRFADLARRIMAVPKKQIDEEARREEALPKVKRGRGRPRKDKTHG